MRDFIKQTGLQRQPVRERVISVKKNIPAFMKSYPGTTISLGSHSKIEKVIEDAFDELQRQGYPLPQTTKIDAQFFVNRRAKTTSPCAFMNGVLYINEQHSFWNDPGKTMARWFKKHKFSTNRPEGVIWHETGHLVHKQNNQAIYNQFIYMDFANTGDELIALQVSDYAQESADEFVAEVFSAHIAKMDSSYPLEVFMMYQKYGCVF